MFWNLNDMFEYPSGSALTDLITSSSRAALRGLILMRDCKSARYGAQTAIQTQ